MSAKSVKKFFENNNLPLKEFSIVYPAGGSNHSAIKISVDMLANITNGEWIDVCKDEEN